MSLTQNIESAYDSLRWYAQMGVDLCVEATPQRVEAVKTPPPATRQPEKPSAPASLAATSIASAVAEARAAADASETLTDLEAAVRGLSSCALKKTATNSVFAHGLASSGLMWIGDAPGADEDRSGIPFSGASGQLLDKMLHAIGLHRTQDCYLTHCLFWRPPGNRQPTAEEIAICLPLVEKHIALAAPRLLVLMGGTAAAAILNETRGITRLRGQVFSYQNRYMGRAVPAHVLYHPNYLLRQPLAKKQAWADLLTLKAALSS